MGGMCVTNPITRIYNAFVIALYSHVFAATAKTYDWHAENYSHGFPLEQDDDNVSTWADREY